MMGCRRFVLLFLAATLSLAEGVNAQVLYEISGKGLKKSSFILGTSPYVAVSTVTEIDNVFKCFNDCDGVVGEIAVNEEEMQKLMLKMVKMDESISDFLSVEEAALVDSALRKEMNLSLSDVGHMRPAMVLNIYNMTMCEKLFPRKEDDTQMDSFFQRAAIDLGKPIYGLEPVEEQLKLLYHGQSIERQAKRLVEAIRNSNKIRESIDAVNEIYVNGDTEALYEWIVKNNGYTEADKFLFIDTRNNAWIENMERLMRKRSCFVVVGAEHLPGREGLISLLKRKGYQVKPVK